MPKLGYPVASMVLASVLAQMRKRSLQQSLIISQGSSLIFFTRPIAAVFLVLALASVFRHIWVQVRSPAPEVALRNGDK